MLIMVRTILVIIVLFLYQSTAFACSCLPARVMPISEMLEHYDHVFMAHVDEAIDYNNNHWPIGWHEELNREDFSKLVRKMTPTKKAKIRITEVFKGRLEGSVDLNFEAEGGNCAGGYYFEGETTLFFLSDVGESLVSAAGSCSPSSQYHYSTDQIREFTKNGTEPKLLSNYCAISIKKLEDWAEVAGDKHIETFIMKECATQYEIYKLSLIHI